MTMRQLISRPGPFMISVETGTGPAERGGFHLGYDEIEARRLCEERYAGRMAWGLPTVTIALLDGKFNIVDVYDGSEWQNGLVWQGGSDCTSPD